MKAISLKPEWALPVMLGVKTIECRTWKTDYRGPLLICASASKVPGCISGHALCTVNLLDIEPFKPEHLDDALIDDAPAGAYAWRIELADWIEPFTVKGKLHLYDVDDELINSIPESVTNSDALDRFYEPLVHWGRDESTWREWWQEVTAHCR